MKRPDPKCRYCKGRGLVGEPGKDWVLDCVCVNERELDEPATDRERVV